MGSITITCLFLLRRQIFAAWGCDMPNTSLTPPRTKTEKTAKLPVFKTPSSKQYDQMPYGNITPSLCLNYKLPLVLLQLSSWGLPGAWDLLAQELARDHCRYPLLGYSLYYRKFAHLVLTGGDPKVIYSLVPTYYPLPELVPWSSEQVQKH